MSVDTSRLVVAEYRRAWLARALLRLRRQLAAAIRGSRHEQAQRVRVRLERAGHLYDMARTACVSARVALTYAIDAEVSGS